MTIPPNDPDGWDIDVVIPPNDTLFTLDLLPLTGTSLDLSVASDELSLVLGGDGPNGQRGPTGPTGPCITVTESEVAPSDPSPADVWVDIGPPRVTRVWDGLAWQNVMTGPTGPTGPRGPAGPPGSVGPTGAAGVAGAQGVTGPTGPGGAVGPTGPGANLKVQDENVDRVTNTAILDFQGAGVTATLGTTGEAVITIPGGEASTLLPVRVATGSDSTLTGLLSVDGVTVAAGDRVLVRSQTNSAQNGIYVAASGAWTRATDADTAAKVARGTRVWTTAAGSFRKMTEFTQLKAVTTIGTDAQEWKALTHADMNVSLGRPTPNGDGHLFFNKENRQMEVWDTGTVTWIPAGGSLVVTSTTRPPYPVKGTVIYESDTQRTYTYDGNSWVVLADASQLYTLTDLTTSVTKFSGWNPNVVKALKIGPLVYMTAHIYRTASTRIIGGSSGNIGDTSIFTVPAGWDPYHGSYFVYNVDGVFFGNGYFTNAGTFALQTLHANAIIDQNSDIHANFVYSLIS